MSDSPATLHERLRALRESRGMARKQLAALVDATPAALGHWESGRTRPKQYMLLRLAAALRIAVEELAPARSTEPLDGALAPRPRGCQWPIGEPRTPGFRYCGAALAGEGAVYCRAHVAIAYVHGRERTA